MEFKVVKKAEYKTTKWPGGTTAELIIFPKEALYSERNFKWRLSSASVEAETSAFTSLPGIERILMVLKGELFLEHKDHHSVKLMPYEQDSFSGQWDTVSYGKATDFNLMLAEGCRGKLEVIQMHKGPGIGIRHDEYIEGEENLTTEVFYCAEGEIRFQYAEHEEVRLYKEDLVYIIGAKNTDILKFYSAYEESTLIRAVISCKSGVL